jgi:UDPglucose--hexose-1-phosphate uridylyltransferase
MSELRVDALSGETVIVAPGRSQRPRSQQPAGPVAHGCPFCPGQEDQTSPAVLELALDGSPGWFVRVFPNLYPIVSVHDDATAGPASGAHEVIVETPLHDQEMADRSPEELGLTLLAYRGRLKTLGAAPSMRYVSVFRNQGAAAGSSLAHPHSQVVALRYVPAKVAQMVRRWRRHFRQTGRCLLCDEIAHERGSGQRVVVEQDGFVVYAPHGAVLPGELILAPVDHAGSFGDVPDAVLAGFSRVLIDMLRRLRAAFEDPPHNLVLQTWPVSRRRDEALHWYVRIAPRLAVLGGFELATGDYVSTLSPEDAAALYRGL